MSIKERINEATEDEAVKDIIIEKMCDNYCKYSDNANDDICDNCPLSYIW